MGHSWLFKAVLIQWLLPTYFLQLLVGFTARDQTSKRLSLYHTSSKRILLVGATGYAGRKLANYLLTDTDATVTLTAEAKSVLVRE